MSIPKFWLIVGLMIVLGAGCAPAKPPFTPQVKSDFSAEDRAQWRELAKWPDQCEEEFAFGADDGVGGLALFSYEPNEAILRVTCGVYAYQTNMLFFRVTTNGQEKNVRPVSLSTYDLEQKKVVPRAYEYEDDIPGTVLGFDTFNPQEKTLTIFAKDRGVGDCGTRETFAVDPELKLQKVEYMSCEAADEFHLQNPDAEAMPEWPVVYETK